MSAIALSWVASLQVGNTLAKNLLRFYASNNFQNLGEYEFHNETLAYQLEVSESSIKKAHKYLVDKGFITRKERTGKTGVQIGSVTNLCIPNDFIVNHMKMYQPVDKKGGEGLQSAPYRLQSAPTRGSSLPPLNIINNNNKKLLYRDEQKKATNTKEWKGLAPSGTQPSPLLDDFKNRKEKT